MASNWARGLSIEMVPNSMVAKPVTIVLPFYENHEFLKKQIATWREYPDVIWRHLSAVIVDDGSSVPATLPKDLPFTIRLFRIDVDVPWNWLAARNIGAHHAQDGWLLLTDMDHVVPQATAESLVCGQHDPNVVYVFSRREHSGESVTPHSASFFMTRKMFWKIGGYDERLAGVYGTDGSYRKRVMEQASVRVLTDELVRYEFVADSSVSRYERKTEAMRQKRASVFASVPAGSSPKVLSFPYHEVHAHQAVSV